MPLLSICEGVSSGVIGQYIFFNGLVRNAPNRAITQRINYSVAPQKKHCVFVLLNSVHCTTPYFRCKRVVPRKKKICSTTIEPALNSFFAKNVNPPIQYRCTRDTIGLDLCFCKVCFPYNRVWITGMIKSAVPGEKYQIAVQPFGIYPIFIRPFVRVTAHRQQNRCCITQTPIPSGVV